MPWRFHDRLNAQGQNAIRQWLESDVPPKARLKIDQRLRNLRVADRLKPPFVKKIHGYRGVFELVIEYDKVQYRPLGGYGPKKGDFTFVLGAIEKNDTIHPVDAFATAAKHIDALEKDLLRVCDHEYENPPPTSATSE